MEQGDFHQTDFLEMTYLRFLTDFLEMSYLGLLLKFVRFFHLRILCVPGKVATTHRGWTQTGYINKHYNINQKDEDT
jgi:hypothetical protein